MRNILSLIGLLIVGFAGVGWYMGWYKLSVARSGDGNLEIKTNVDTKKVGDDSSNFFKKAAAVVGSQVEKTAADAKLSVPVGTPGSTPGPVSPSSPFNPMTPAEPSDPAPPTAPAPAPIKLFAPK